MKNNTPAMLLADFYKVSHRKLYPENTETIYSTWTCRGSRMEGVNETVVFGFQGFIKKYLIEYFNENFFNKNIDDIVKEYSRIIKFTLGEQNPDIEHIIALHKLGYLPLEIKTLPEGTLCPIRVPCMTVKNTLPEFFWLTNFIETLLSAEVWQPITSATIAYQYRKLLDGWAIKTCDNNNYVDFQAHDFSFRGMPSVESAQTSGAGHLLSFTGTDTIPAIIYLENYYNANIENELVGTSLPATEHSVACANGLDEYKTFKRIITEVHPNGFVSIVSDTWNLWDVLTKTIPALKDDILNRDGKVVIRPDCYDEETEILTNNGWKLFKNLKNEEDKVAQYNQDGSIDFVLPLKYFEADYEGDMYRFNNIKNNINLVVTPNHRVVKRRKSDNNIIIQNAKDIKFGSHSFEYVCAGNKIGEINNLTPYERLLIAYQADGRCRGKTIEFQFAKQRKIDRLKGICEQGGFKYKISEPKYREFSKHNGNWNNQVNFTIYLDSEPAKNFKEWVNVENKNYQWCQQFIEEISYWDGCRRSETRFKYDSTVKENVELVQIVSILAGFRTKFSSYEDNRSDKFNTIYTLNINKYDYIGGQAIIKEIIQYNGKVYCVQVPSGMLVVRRDGQVSISGNSGNPVDIISGLEQDIELPEYEPYGNQISKGVIELLWDIFGGTINEKGYKVLDSHIGAIYGDAITLERADEICKRLEAKGFASSNIVFGVGSFTYTYNTRDTFGQALKSTYAVINGEEKLLFKDPITDDGLKKSQKGLVSVIKDGKNLKLVDNLNQEEYNKLNKVFNMNQLETVFLNGKVTKKYSLSEIREKLKGQ